MAEVQIYNSKIDRYVLMDDEKKSGFIECKKQPFEGVPVKGDGKPETVQAEPEPAPVESDISEAPSMDKNGANNGRKKGGLFSFLSS